MLNLVCALNLSVCLSSTGLALKVRLQFRTCSHLFCFFVLFFFWCCMRMDKNRLFQEGSDLKPKKKLLVNLLPFFLTNRWNSRPKRLRLNPEYYY